MNRPSGNSRVQLSGPFAAIFLTLLMLYFGPLGLILLDEFVFGNWLYRATPGWLHEWAEIVYWPVLVVLDWLGVV